MSEILYPAKALSVNPLKNSQPIGASLAILGLQNAMPLEHGARGCTSFDKLFFMRHFREPIALQTTAMDQFTAILGADSNVVEALATICRKNAPDVIGLITTGLSEMQGADIPRTVALFRETYPQYAAVAVVPVSASDTLGCLETGFAAGVESIIATLVPADRTAPTDPRQVNVLASAMLTPGDIDVIKSWIAAFGLHPIVLPDIGDSLDGHMIPQGFSTLSYGGTPRERIAAMTRSSATLVVGAALDGAADLLREKTGIADYRFDGLMGLKACDAFTMVLQKLSGRAVPSGLCRARARLTDALADCQFQIGGTRVAVAADCDHARMLIDFLNTAGAEVVTAVVSARTNRLGTIAADRVIVGDLEDLEKDAKTYDAELIVTNSHGVEIAKRVGAAHLHAGFPIYDSYGAPLKQWVGYDGSRQTLFDIANLLLAHYREIRPYRSRFWKGTPREKEGRVS